MNRFAGVLAVMSLSFFSLGAQQNLANTSVNAPPSKASNSTLSIDVVVDSKAGAPVAGLPQQAFTLLDNKHPIPLTSFRAVNVAAGTPAPYIEVIVVLDAINADPLKAGLEREGIMKFLQANGGKLPLPVSVLVLTDEPTPMQSPPSTDGNAQATFLTQQQTGLRIVNRSQGVVGAAERLNLSLAAINALAARESNLPGRKLVLWVSPGWANLPFSPSNVTTSDRQRIFHSIVALSARLRDQHITLYNIQTRAVAGTNTNQFNAYTQYLEGAKSPDGVYPANLSLQVLAVQTGGRVLNESNDLPAAIAGEIAAAASEAPIFYNFTFQAAPAEHANQYHSLEVKVNSPGLTAHTRTGYYAQP